MADNLIFNRRWFMCDFARLRVFVRREFTLWLDALQRLGYNGLGIYLEGAFAFSSVPGVIREGVMTYDDAAWIMSECAKRDIFVFPMTNVVGHMEHFFRQERFSALVMENTDPPHFQLDFFKEEAEAFVMNIVRAYTGAFPCGMIHIGADETRLTEENKIPYAKFIAKICKNLLDEGIQPAIWDDMFWMDLPLCDYLDRRTFIFDWNYYGHRPESVAYFKNAGFQDIVVCPCDNSWEGFITYQHASGYLKAHGDIPLLPDEIEAFFEDARNVGVMGGLLTNWNNEHGRNMWAQWSTFARAALFMTGKLEPREQNDALIEAALFGRITPYTQVTKLFQTEIPYNQNCEVMRNALFFRSYIPKVFAMAKATSFTPPHDYCAIAAKAEALLDAWIPANEFERNCAMAMYGVAGMLRASSAILDAMNLYGQYKTAAKLQFDSPDTASQIVFRMSAKFRHAVTELKSFAAIHGKAIAGTGHNPIDIDFILENADILEKIADLLDAANETITRIPLPRFDRIIDHAVNRTPL